MRDARASAALGMLLLLPVVWGCRSAAVEAAGPSPPPGEPAPAADASAPGTVDDPWASKRAAMVEDQIASRDVDDARVLDAMRAVPRHRFVPAAYQNLAYGDHPLPLAHGQTISQPYIVALMSQMMALDGSERVLEVGTGSGYQAAVLGALAAEVHTIEIVEPLCRDAASLLAEAAGDHVHVHCGDGYRGWPDAAPFDAIMVTAAPDHVPQPLIDQLAPGGRLVLPVGPEGRTQWLKLLIKGNDGEVVEQTSIPVVFVPMTGEAQSPDR